MSSRKGKEKVKPKSKKNLSTLSTSLEPPPARVPPDGGSLSIHMFMPTPGMVPATHSSSIQSPSDMAHPTQSPSSRVPTTQSPTGVMPSTHSTPAMTHPTPSPSMAGSPQPHPMVSPAHHSPTGPPPPPSHQSNYAAAFQSTSTETASTSLGVGYQRYQLGPDENIIPMPGGA